MHIFSLRGEDASNGKSANIASNVSSSLSFIKGEDTLHIFDRLATLFFSTQANKLDDCIEIQSLSTSINLHFIQRDSI
jgi:hypothetical protein